MREFRVGTDFILNNCDTQLFGIDEQISELRQFTNLFFNTDNIITLDDEVIKRLGIYNNVLLEGRPGVGKSRSVLHLAKELKQNNTDVDLFSFNIGSILDSDLGSSSKNIELYLSKLRTLALNGSGIIVFFDEIDWIGLSRWKKSEHDGVRRSLTSLFLELDNNINIPNFLFIGATNAPKLLDSALKRRFSKIIKYPAVIDKNSYHLLVNYIFQEDFPETIVNKMYKIVEDKRLTVANIKDACRNAYVTYKVSNGDLTSLIIENIEKIESTLHQYDLEYEYFNQ